MQSSWLSLLFAILMTLPISTSYAGGGETLSDTDLDKIGAAGEVVALDLPPKSELSAEELEALDGQGWGSPTLGWPLAVGHNEAWVFPQVENPVSLPSRPPPNFGIPERVEPIKYVLN